MCEGSRDGRRTRATARSRQEASRREDKGADARGRHGEGGGAATSALDAVEGKWGVRVHQMQEVKGKEGTGDPGGPDSKRDAIRPEVGSVRPEKKMFLLMYIN